MTFALLLHIALSRSSPHRNVFPTAFHAPFPCDRVDLTAAARYVVAVMNRPQTLAVLITIASAVTSAAATEPITYDFGVPGAIITYDDARPVFEFHTSFKRKDPENRVLRPTDFADASRAVSGNTTTLIYAKPPAPWPESLRVTITLTRLAGEVEARLRFSSDGGFRLDKLKFPILDVVPTWHYDTLLMSHPMGDAMYYPQRVIGGRLGGEAKYRYPATLSMQYMVMFNQARSYYLSAYSTGDETFEHSALNIRGGMRLACVWFPFVDKGEWASPPCGVAVLPGSWHTAADLYRSRMAKVFRPPPLPKWMRESFHGWGQVSFKGAEKNPPFRFTDIPKLYDRLESIGLNVLHIFSWGAGGFDNDYPLRFPSPNNGTPEELRAAMDTVRARGGHVILYTNGRLIDPDTPFYNEHGGNKAIALDEHGEPYEETYNHLFYVACPWSQTYQDALFDNVHRLVLDYHAGAAQIDQVACTPAEFCYDTTHGHTTPANNWLAPTDAYLKRIHDFYRAHDPDFFVWAEGTSERYGRFYEVHQHHGEEGTWTVGDSLPEQFRYTYPDFLLTGIADGIPALCHTYGQGKPFDFHWRRFDNKDWVWLITRLIAVRKAEPEYFLRGRFLDTVGVDCHGADIRWWRIDRTDGRPGTLVNLWARGRDLKQPARADLHLPHRDWPLRPVYPEDLTIGRDGSWRTLQWTGPVATLITEPSE
jgi:hypothetical protein